MITSAIDFNSSPKNGICFGIASLCLALNYSNSCHGSGNFEAILLMKVFDIPALRQSSIQVLTALEVEQLR